MKKKGYNITLGIFIGLIAGVIVGIIIQEFSDGNHWHWGYC